MEARWPPLAKGILSFAIPAVRSAHRRRSENTASAQYCYSVFLRHFAHLAQFTSGTMPQTVAEFGPGDSLGTGLAAVIAGAKRYIALDVQDHTNVEANLRVFDELTALFRNRTPIPGGSLLIATQPPQWEFPEPLAAGIDRALDDKRLQAIRNDIIALSGEFISFAVPWNGNPPIKPHSVDWLFSHSVMEHVDDIEHAYACCSSWLADDGHMTHEIDYGSHGLTRHWNGHWTVDSRMWRLIRGARPFLINRFPHATQLETASRHGFHVLNDITVKRSDGCNKERFAAPFAGMTDDSARTHIGFIVCGKKNLSNQPTP